MAEVDTTVTTTRKLILNGEDILEIIYAWAHDNHGFTWACTVDCSYDFGGMVYITEDTVKEDVNDE